MRLRVVSMAKLSDPKRVERSHEEIRRIYEEFPHVREIHKQLTASPSRLIVQHGGEGRSVLQVYLPESFGRWEAFLWVFTELEKSYINWSRQPDPEICRKFWNNLAKNARNKAGSELKPGLDVERIVNVALRYAEAVDSHRE